MHTKAQIKFTSLASIGSIVSPEKVNSEKWVNFLKEKGHTVETFNYMPEHLQLNLKFSFAKRK